MTKFGLLGAAAILSMAVTPVFAQPAISEPGAFAFYHPDGDLGAQTGKRSARVPGGALTCERVASLPRA